MRKPLIFFFLAIMGIALTIILAIKLNSEMKMKDWPRVIGTVSSVEVVGTRAFHPVVSYSYIVNDVEYQSMQHLEAPGFGGKRKRWDVADKTAALYNPGMEIDVYYNPDDPSESRLIVGPTYGIYLQLTFGLLLTIIGLVLFWKFNRGGRFRQS